MKANALFSAGARIVIAATLAISIAHPAPAGERCLESRVSLDAASAERLCLFPESVLADADAFWRTDRAYWLTSLWHKDVGYPVPPPGWEYRLKQIEARTAEQRLQAKELILARDCLVARTEFVEYATRHVCSFLPDSRQDVESTIYLTAAIVPNAFQKDFDVVINLGAIRGGRDEIFNTAIHVLFHVGYYRNEPLRAETLLNNEAEHDFIYSLQNEGMATYVAYLASEKYKSLTGDYSMLEDTVKVHEAIAAINSLVGMVQSESEESFRKKLHETGVINRALYVAGAHMARTIDETSGRDALIATLAAGPRTFMAAYNGIVAPRERVREFPVPAVLTPFQRLHRSTVDGDYSSARGAIREIRDNRAAFEKIPGHPLQISGQLALYKKEFDLAVDIFSLYAELKPDHSNPPAGLAEAYLGMGEEERALECCRRVLDLAPGHARAHEIIAAVEDPH